MTFYMVGVAGSGRWQIYAGTRADCLAAHKRIAPQHKNLEVKLWGTGKGIGRPVYSARRILAATKHWPKNHPGGFPCVDVFYRPRKRRRARAVGESHH